MAGRSGEKTSFAIACGLLSQYVKDKGNSLNLNLGMGESYQRPTTMRFLPGADVEPETQIEENSTAFVSVSSSRNEMELFPQTAGFDATNTSQDKPAKQAEKSQLTIFYGGRVVVFDNYPADKVQELMSFASKGSSASGNSTCVPPTSPSSSQISATDQSTVPLPSAQVQAAPKPAQAKISDLPIMRKASLQRFLEKRKDRLNAKAPYQQQQVCTSKKESAAPKKENVEELWFGLGPKV